MLVTYLLAVASLAAAFAVGGRFTRRLSPAADAVLTGLGVVLATAAGVWVVTR